MQSWAPGSSAFRLRCSAVRRGQVKTTKHHPNIDKGRCMLHRYVLRAVVVSTFVFMVVAFIQISGGQGRNDHDLRGFPQPQVRRSSHGRYRPLSMPPLRATSCRIRRLVKHA